MNLTDLFKRIPTYRILALFLLLIPTLSFAQLAQASSEKAFRPVYLSISFGMHHATFRDFATSPLFYTGNPMHLSLAHIDMDAKRESSIRGAYSFGNFSNDFNQHDASSKVDIISISYAELFQIPQLSTPKLNVKVGGQLNSTVNIRENELLRNNSNGFEIISTLFGSIKGTLDLSRKKDRQGKFLFCNYTLKKRKRALAWGISIGLLNTSYRNGFIYTRQSPLLNQDNITDGYQFRFFSGYRMSSTLDYTVWLNNKNAIQLSYVWDIYSTGKVSDKLEMASHLFNLSLLFNLK